MPHHPLYTLGQAALRTVGALVMASALCQCQIPNHLAGDQPIISKPTLAATVSRQIPQQVGDQPYIMISDRRYVPIDERDAFAAFQDANTFYAEDMDDCDDQAFGAKAKIIEKQQAAYFQGMPAAFGMAWTPKHVFNVFLDPAGQLRVVDRDGFIGGPELFEDKVSLVVF